MPPHTRNTTDAQKVKDGEDHSVAEKAEFPPDSTTCELLRRAEPHPESCPPVTH